MLLIAACGDEQHSDRGQDAGRTGMSPIEQGDAGPSAMIGAAGESQRGSGGSRASGGSGAGGSGRNSMTGTGGVAGAGGAGAQAGSGGRGRGQGGANGGTGGLAQGGHAGAGTSGQAASGMGGAGASGAGASGGSGAAAPGVFAGVRFIGRVDGSDPNQPRFGWSGSGFIAAFHGQGLSAQLDNGDGYVFKTVIDDMPQPVFTAQKGQASYMLASNLADGAHTVALYRQTEGQQGNTRLLGLSVTGGSLSAPPPGKARSIEIVGNSISCGYGDLGADQSCGFSYATESHYDSYEALLGRALDAEVSTIAVSGRGVYRNGDGSTGDIMPLRYDRILANDETPKWSFELEPQAVIVELGTNDFAPGVPGAAFTDAYVAFVRVIRGKYPHALIVCTIGPMMSDSYPEGQNALTAIRGYVDDVISARMQDGDDNIDVFEFSMNVDGDYGCDYHPNVAKHKQMADAFGPWLKQKLGW